ncbi:uncharacterized protein RCC_10767 [Ramularia collo-cygni]|uniref:Uncharacterized protein n=1 Tax=Ramularia collo-cygni TaxID=112498 RepID=A0A2D3VMH5_9PEZI|nr:uncharacterized protein RCC_10767 [Ramularia collo-cygni]CZT25039.1 uncharacterized protein RCC_10767 [Ramularia collo-cygni]
MSRPIGSPRQRSESPAATAATASRSFGTSYRSQHGADSYIASIAEESIRKDLEENGDLEDDEQLDDEEVGLSRTTTQDNGMPPMGSHSMTGYYRRPSWIGVSPRPFLGSQQPESVVPSDWEAAIGEERSLLRDNKIIPPKHPRRRESGDEEGGGSGLRKVLSISGFSSRKKSVPALSEEAEDQVTPGETTALLSGRDPNAPYGGEGSPENVAKIWEEAVENGQIQTTWQREMKVLCRYSGMLDGRNIQLRVTQALTIPQHP